MKRKSCLNCSKFISCRSTEKSASYKCEKFTQIREIESFDSLDRTIDILPVGEVDPDKDLLAGNKSSVYDLVSVTPGMKMFNRTLDKIADKRDNEDTKLVNKLDNYSDEEIDALAEKDDFIWTAMQEAYDPLTNSVRDVKIDDRDLKLAYNYYDFCTNVAGKAIKAPFSRQLYIAVNLLGEFCPRCTDPNYLDLNNVPVDMESREYAKKIVMMKHGRCPRCGVTKAQLILGGELKDINELALLLGQRAGKSSFISTLSSDIGHRFLKAPRLSNICAGIQEFTPLTATFVALTASRAIKLLWNPFIAIIDSSSWFQDYFSMLRSYGREYDRELYKKTGLYLHFHHKNLAFYPSPPMKKTLRGDTRFLAATDELSFFSFNPNRSSSDDMDEGEDERERADGPEVQASLSNSLSTIRTEVYALYKKNISVIPTGFNLNISSPASRNDTLSVIERDSHEPGSLTFGLRLPTWEVNPLWSRNHPVVVEAYRKNPVKAERDYGANPPEMSSSLFTSDTIEKLFNKEIVNSHKILLLESPSTTQGKIVCLAPSTEYHPAVLAMDAGLVNNSFGYCVGYRKDTKFYVHSIGELIPSQSKPINYPGTYSNILLPLAQQVNACIVGADRWNSINILQQFEQDVPTIKYVQHMLRYKDFLEFIAAVNNGDVVLPGLELPMDRILLTQDYRKELANMPMSHLALQMYTVRDTGTSVVKGDKYTDDMFRCLVLAYKLAFSSKTKSHLNKSKIKRLDKKTNNKQGRILVSGRSLLSMRTRLD